MLLSAFLTILLYIFNVHSEDTKWYFHWPEETESKLNQTFFPNLINYHINGRLVTEHEYPWIARVLHSQKNFEPFMCTAICIDDNIFITAARCVTFLKVIYTSLIYKSHRLTVKAFVLPTKGTKQFFDDIGFIIVNNEYTGYWHKIQTFKEKRTDNDFKWFKKMKFEEFDHKVVGYAMKQGTMGEPRWKTSYQLTELDVVIDKQLCRDVLPYKNLIVGFDVPCYHSCPYKSLLKYIYPKSSNQTKDERCRKYHGVLGGALINIKSKKLFGVATWAAYEMSQIQLPVGFSVPNSESYFEDYACSLRIRNSQETNTNKGYYQKLCDDAKKNKSLRNENRDIYSTENNWLNFLY